MRGINASRFRSILVNKLLLVHTLYLLIILNNTDGGKNAAAGGPDKTLQIGIPIASSVAALVHQHILHKSANV